MAFGVSFADNKADGVRELTEFFLSFCAAHFFPWNRTTDRAMLVARRQHRYLSLVTGLVLAMQAVIAPQCVCAQPIRLSGLAESTPNCCSQRDAGGVPAVPRDATASACCCSSSGERIRSLGRHRCGCCLQNANAAIPHPNKPKAEQESLELFHVDSLPPDVQPIVATAAALDAAAPPPGRNALYCVWLL